MYMLDTNTCIFVLKSRTTKLKNKFKAIKNICISSISYAELCYGIENGSTQARQERYHQLDIFTQRLLVNNWNAEAARHYAFIRAALKQQGKMIGHNDLLIAAHARSINAVLVTNNTLEFSRIPDITLEDWV